METDQLAVELDELRSDLAQRGLALWTSLPAAEVRGLDGGGTGDGSYTISGYAAVFDTPTVLYDGKFLRITEEIAPCAFTQALEDPELLVHLNHGHDMNSAVATTDVPPNEIGGLELRQDATGLPYFARVDSADPDAQKLAVKMHRKVVKGASFKFKIGQEDRIESEDPGGKTLVHYRINQVSKLFDVCACAQGQYRQATSTIRSAFEALDSRSDQGSLGTPRRTPVGVNQAAREVGRDDDEREQRVVERRREAERVRAYQQLADSQTRSV